MTKKTAFIFPGQGAQYVGMGRDFFDNFEVAKDIFQEADDLLKENFSKLIFFGDENELNLTRNSQLSIYIVSSAILKVIRKEFELVPFVSAGLSLGEYTALFSVNCYSFKDGLLLVKSRGELMHLCCEKNPGRMSVVLGLEESIIEDVLHQLTNEKVWAANFNCPGQVVISGSLRGVEIAERVLKEKGAKKLIPLLVEGAFHTPLMEDARGNLEEMISNIIFQEPNAKVVMNVSGCFASKDEIKRLLIDQVVKPVRWAKGIEVIAEEVDEFVEIGCGKTLSGMNRKIGVKVPTISIEKVEELCKL